MGLEVFPPPLYCEKVYVRLVISSLKCLKEFIVIPSGPGIFLFEKFMEMDSIYLLHMRLLRFLSFVLCQFGQVAFFKKVAHLIQVVEIVGRKVFIIIPYPIWDIMSTRHNNHPYISDTGRKQCKLKPQ